MSISSTDSASIKWINSLNPEKQKLAKSLAIHPASQIVENLSPIYNFLHKKTIMYKTYDSPYGLLDCKTAKMCLTDETKENILKFIRENRENYIKL